MLFENLPLRGRTPQRAVTWRSYPEGQIDSKRKYTPCTIPNYQRHQTTLLTRKWLSQHRKACWHSALQHCWLCSRHGLTLSSLQIDLQEKRSQLRAARSRPNSGSCLARDAHREGLQENTTIAKERRKLELLHEARRREFLSPSQRVTFSD